MSFQLRNAVLDYFPYRSQVNTHVVVNQHISQPGYSLPGNSGMRLAELRRQMFGRLADNLKLADYSVLPVILLQEGLVDAKAIVSHTFGLGEARAVMQAVVDGSRPIIKAVALPHG